MNVFKRMESKQLDNHMNQSYQKREFDMIIVGAGCAGLSLLHAILKSDHLNHLSILVIDKSLQKTNDRTWCFWESDSGPFEKIVCKKWDQISVHKNNFNTQLATAPFTYKMIEGLDFYNYVIDYAKKFDNVYWEQAVVQHIEQHNTTATVCWEGGTAITTKVFSSILPMDQLYPLSQSTLAKPFLWQHFKGFLIQFETAVFDDKVAKLMDFNVEQKGATAFMYVLPLNASKALVEYTLFSKTLLSPSDYEAEIRAYLAKYYPHLNYQILHEEIGAIPMTTNSFAKSTPPIYVIGTLGNAVKSSTGYAFRFIQEQVSQIVKALEQGTNIQTEIHQTRHQFYDAVLLYILDNNLMEGSEIFKRIFEKNEAATIFKFLANTSSIWDDIRIMRSLPTAIFLPAAFKVLFRRA